MKKRFIAICGPTASGKSALSVALAGKINAEILSFDASQAFAGADIGTAKIAEAEMGAVPHHLLDIIRPDRRLEAGYFIDRAHEAFNDIEKRSKVPLICAGTSMYLSLFFEGIAQTGEGSSELRQSLEAKDNQTIYEMLREIDPERAAALHPNDRLRTIRALEISSVTGKTASQLYAEQQKESGFNCLLLILCWDREELGKRIEARVDQMIESGLVAECQCLLQQAGPQAQIFDSIGYAETLQFLNNELKTDELKSLIAMHTKQLAKKQMTFLRRFPLKHAFISEPKQEFEDAPPATKPSKLDFNTVSMTLEQIGEYCVKYLQNSDKKPENRAIYLNAPALLQALAVR